MMKCKTEGSGIKEVMDDNISANTDDDMDESFKRCLWYEEDEW